MVSSGLQVGVNVILASSTYIVAQAMWKCKLVLDNQTHGEAETNFLALSCLLVLLRIEK